MQLSLEDIKALVLWMKDQKVTSFQWGPLGVNFSPLAFATTGATTEEKKTPEQIQKEEDEILFHSAG